MTRTVVVSDLHGRADLLTRALDHAGFGGGDSLIIAGDLVDVGTDDTISLAEELGATVLAGNHEVSAAIGLRISPQNPETLKMGPELARRFASGEWPLATAVDGWLITHAGVSVALDDIVMRAGGDPESVATVLNDLFRTEISSAVRRMPVTWDDLASFRLIGGEMGPLWFRPMSLHHVPSGLRQVVGHTPPEMLSESQLAALESRGWRLVEPGNRGEAASAYRYAVIEDGESRVEEAPL